MGLESLLISAPGCTSHFSDLSTYHFKVVSLLLRLQVYANEV